MLPLTLLEHLRILAYYWLVLELKLVYDKVHSLQALDILDATVKRDPLTLTWPLWELHVWGGRDRLELLALNADFECDEGARIPVLVTNKDFMLQGVVNSIFIGDHYFLHSHLAVDIWSQVDRACAHFLVLAVQSQLRDIR